MRGTAIIRGEPGRAVRVDLPNEVVMPASGGRRVKLRNMRSASTGGSADRQQTCI